MADEPSLYEGDVFVDYWVEELQRSLQAEGFDPGPIDGWFGPKTKAAVEAFQRDKGLDCDGVAGNQTWAALRGRDPEPEGVNNGPHGDTRPHHDQGGGGHSGSGSSGTLPGGYGASYGDLDLTFTSDPWFDTSDSRVVVDLDQQGVMNVPVYVRAHMRGAGVDHESEWMEVNSTGEQRIPLGISPVPGEYEVIVYASGQGGNATASRSAIVTF